jgi:hypothetical protein
MQYYRCKCGAREAWGSMPPYRCTKCEKCGSDLATDPGLHDEPVPHDFSAVKTVETDQGTATITRCRLCLRTLHEIERGAA